MEADCEEKEIWKEEKERLWEQKERQRRKEGYSFGFGELNPIPPYQAGNWVHVLDLPVT